jgi:hypothetical protein
VYMYDVRSYIYIIERERERERERLIICVVENSKKCHGNG